jgi:hypothetical protein
MRGPVSQNIFSLLDAAIANKQPKRNISLWFPSLVVASNTRRLAQVSKSTHQSTDEWAARLGVMNNAHDGWLREGTIYRHVSFEYVRSQAKNSELKVCMRRRQLKQVR